MGTRIVVGGILIFLLVSMYGAWDVERGYATRVTMGSLVLAASDCRTRVLEHVKSASGALPAGGQWGCESRVAGTHPITKYLQKVETNEFGDVRVTYPSMVDQDEIERAEGPISDEVLGKMIILRPSATAGAYTAPIAGRAIADWACGPQAGQDPDIQKYLPGTCRNEITPQGTFAESSR